MSADDTATTSPQLAMRHRSVTTYLPRLLFGRWRLVRFFLIGLLFAFLSVVILNTLHVAAMGVLLKLSRNTIAIWLLGFLFRVVWGFNAIALPIVLVYVCRRRITEGGLREDLQVTRLDVRSILRSVVREALLLGVIAYFAVVVVSLVKNALVGAGMGSGGLIALFSSPHLFFAYSVRPAPEVEPLALLHRIWFLPLVDLTYQIYTLGRAALTAAIWVVLFIDINSRRSALRRLPLIFAVFCAMQWIPDIAEWILTDNHGGFIATYVERSYLGSPEIAARRLVFYLLGTVIYFVIFWIVYTWQRRRFCWCMLEPNVPE